MRYADAGNGITRDSVEFFREHRHRLGVIVEASVRFPGFDDPHDPCLMVLRDAAGDEIALSGCTAGYPGEGPRGAMQVLVEAGWPADQAALVFTTPTLRLERPEISPLLYDVPGVPAPPSRARRQAAPTTVDRSQPMERAQ
jgi:hypothetical protein